MGTERTLLMGVRGGWSEEGGLRGKMRVEGGGCVEG
jgi:hypothetical protein